QRGCAAAGCPGCHQEPLSPPLLQRSSVLRSTVQDAQVPPRVPVTIRRQRRWPRVLPTLHPVLQPPAPTLRTRLPHSSRRPLRPRRWHPHRARPCPTSSLPCSPRTLCSPGTSPTAIARTSLDKQ